MSEFGSIVQPNFNFISDQFSNQTHADLKPVKCEFGFIWVKSSLQNEVRPRILLLLFILFALLIEKPLYEEVKDPPQAAEYLLYLVFFNMEIQWLSQVFLYNMNRVKTLKALLPESLEIINVGFTTRLAGVVDVVTLECSSETGTMHLCIGDSVDPILEGRFSIH
jgi:hypothetical protein